AVANYFSDEITLYSRIGESGSLYETTPSTVIGGPESGIHYPHDVAFSPDGSHLAVASRLSNRVTIYGKDAQGQFSSTPLYTLMGKDAKLYVADALSYVPGKNMLAVVNIYSDRVNFYRYNEGGYVTKPF